MKLYGNLYKTTTCLGNCHGYPSLLLGNPIQYNDLGGATVMVGEEDEVGEGLAREAFNGFSLTMYVRRKFRKLCDRKMNL